jgi:hypothetical protein
MMNSHQRLRFSGILKETGRRRPGNSWRRSTLRVPGRSWSELRYLAADWEKWKKLVDDLCSSWNYRIYTNYYYRLGDKNRKPERKVYFLPELYKF